ncbi:MAG: magnesium chelatase [Planctomycetes bacterium]|nr:magnesium chelatase [Planctomycetota bacterium]
MHGITTTTKDASAPATLGELKRSGWRSRSVKEELRSNLIAHLREGRELFPGIVGYGETVVPKVVNAILSGHDFILLGLRGQAKTRLLRSLDRFLDAELPAVDGCEINDDPLHPVCAACVRRAAELGDALPIRWIPRSERYHEKLATPDVTIADLIGDVDPIKAATRKLTFADPEVVHFGILPRSNRGIFAVNELPDLSARIQVGLLNLLEEGDIQIRGFPIRMPLDVLLVFSANPEDYTHRGRIITPLRDRIASQILTHYPRTLEEGLAITAQEAWVERAHAPRVTVPRYVREIVEEVAVQARASELVDHGSGVSARLTIALLENTVSNAERRAHAHGSDAAVARVSDVVGASSSITGKVELVYEGEREGPEKVARHLTGKAIKAVFDRTFPDVYAAGAKDDASKTAEADYAPIVSWFQSGSTLDVSDGLADAELEKRLATVPGLARVAETWAKPANAAEHAAAMEFVLEGLHHSSLLAKDELANGRVYRDMFEDMMRGLKSNGGARPPKGKR